MLFLYADRRYKRVVHTVSSTSDMTPGSNSSWANGASAGSTAVPYGITGVTRSSPSGTSGPPAESTSSGVDGSRTPAPPGVAPAASELRLQPIPTSKADRQEEEIHPLAMAKEQPRATPWLNPRVRHTKTRSHWRQVFVYTPMLQIRSILLRERGAHQHWV